MGHAVALYDFYENFRVRLGIVPVFSLFAGLMGKPYRFTGFEWFLPTIPGSSYLLLASLLVLLPAYYVFVGE